MRMRFLLPMAPSHPGNCAAYFLGRWISSVCICVFGWPRVGLGWVSSHCSSELSLIFVALRVNDPATIYAKCLCFELARMKEAKGKKGAAPVEAKDKKANDKKRSLSVKEKQPKKRQARTDSKAKKDPNQPKRPPTAFFIFLEEFRKSFKEKHPDVKGVTAVGKACGEKWKQMSEEEKAPYNAKAVQKRAEYDKTLTAYKKKQGSREEGGTPEESEKSKSEINDEDDEEEESGDDGDED